MDINGLSILFTPWGPVLMYALTAAVLFGVNPRRFSRVAQGIALSSAWMVLFWVFLWRVVPVPVTHVLRLGTEVVPPLFVRTAVSLEVWPLIGVVGVLAAAGTCVPLRPPPGRVPVLSAGFVLLAGSMLVLVADNLPALLFGWVVVDSALLALSVETRGLVPARALGFSLATALALWLVMVTHPTAVVGAPWRALELPRWALVLLGASAWVRLGAYPFHREWERGRSSLPEPWLWAPAVAGIGWFLQWVRLPGSEAVWGENVWLFLGVVAFFGSALATWTSRSPSVRSRWVLIHRLSALVIVPWVWQGWSFLVGKQLGSVVVLAGVARILLREYPLPRGTKVLSWVAAAWIWGVPGLLSTPWRELPLSVGEWQPLLAAAIFLADALIASALLLPDPVRGQPRWRHVIPISFLLAPLLVWNLMAEPQGFLTVPRWWGAAAIAGGIGAFLAWQYERIFVDVRPWVWGIRVLASLEPVESGARNLVRWGGMAIGGILTLLEGAGWLGWLFFSAVLAWIWRYLGG